MNFHRALLKQNLICYQRPNMLRGNQINRLILGKMIGAFQFICCIYIDGVLVWVSRMAEDCC